MFNPPYKSIAVTGTNGKTSVVWYISKILTSINVENTTLGTLGYFNNGLFMIGKETAQIDELKNIFDNGLDELIN